jgi:hypothetical protein
MRQWIAKRLYRIGDSLLDKQIWELSMAGSIHWYLRKVWKKLKRKWGKNKTRVEIEPGSPWKETEMLTQEKFKDYSKGTDISIPLTVQYNVNPIVKRAQKEEIPAILCKVIDDIHIDRRRGILVNKVLGKNNPFIEACQQQLKRPITPL